MTDTLPPLPDPDLFAWSCGETGIPQITKGNTRDALRAYGAACRAQALGDAAAEVRRLNAALAKYEADDVRYLAETKRLRQVLHDLERAGAPLSNIASNLAQQTGRAITAHEAAIMDYRGKVWSEAARAARAALEQQ